MSVNLHVRNVDAQVARRLKQRAAENNRSAEAEHRATLEQVYGPESKDDWLKRAAALRESICKRHGGPISPGSEVLIREDRDSR